jgi:hypothetical protein
MPLHQFQCEDNHITEKLFRTFAAAEGVSEVVCTECGQTAQRIASVPFPGHFYGEGFYRPSPTKRYNTKLVSQKDGNKHSS